MSHNFVENYHPNTKSNRKTNICCKNIKNKSEIFKPKKKKIKIMDNVTIAL